MYPPPLPRLALGIHTFGYAGRMNAGNDFADIHHTVYFIWLFVLHVLTDCETLQNTSARDHCTQQKAAPRCIL